MSFRANFSRHTFIYTKMPPRWLAAKKAVAAMHILFDRRFFGKRMGRKFYFTCLLVHKKLDSHHLYRYSSQGRNKLLFAEICQLTPRNVACKAGKRKELHEHFEDDENPIITKQGRRKEVYRSGVYTNLKTVPKRRVCSEI